MPFTAGGSSQCAFYCRRLESMCLLLQETWVHVSFTARGSSPCIFNCRRLDSMRLLLQGAWVHASFTEGWFESMHLLLLEAWVHASFIIGDSCQCIFYCRRLKSMCLLLQETWVHVSFTVGGLNPCSLYCWRLASMHLYCRRLESMHLLLQEAWVNAPLTAGGLSPSIFYCRRLNSIRLLLQEARVNASFHYENSSLKITLKSHSYSENPFYKKKMLHWKTFQCYFSVIFSITFVCYDETENDSRIGYSHKNSEPNRIEIFSVTIRDLTYFMNGLKFETVFSFENMW